MINNTVDVVIISDAKTKVLEEVTNRGLITLLKSSDSDIFKIYVVESNHEINYDHLKNTKTIYPKSEFGYHKYLNIGRKKGDSRYVCLCNNDLIYNKYWAESIIKIMDDNQDILSASPFDPFRTPLEYLNEEFIVGYRTEKELSGWCIFQKREIYDIIGDLDERFSFWYCDNDYAQVLKTNNIKHCLVPGSMVIHHNNNVGETASQLLSNKDLKKFTTEQEEIYKNKWNECV